MKPLILLLVACLAMPFMTRAAPVGPPATAPAGHGADVAGEVLVRWTNPQGAAWAFKARIDRPAPQVDRHRAVFMFGGGLVNDLDWTTPGRVTHQGQEMQLTIDGRDHADGRTLAEALRADGWTVIRYSAIRESDPLHAQSPGMAEAMQWSGTLELARFMWRDLLERAEIAPDRVVALGHSLGTPRAVLVSDGKAAGYVFLAGAYLSPTRARPSRLSAQALEAMGEAGADGSISKEEADAALPADFVALDYDGSGDLSGWELAAHARLSSGMAPEGEGMNDEGDPWPTTLLAAGKRPMLAIWGGRDAMSVHGPLLARIATDAGIPLETRCFPDLGHNLGPVAEERTGPIDPAVVEAVVAWLDATFPRDRGR